MAAAPRSARPSPVGGRRRPCSPVSPLSPAGRACLPLWSPPGRAGPGLRRAASSGRRLPSRLFRQRRSAVPAASGTEGRRPEGAGPPPASGGRRCGTGARPWLPAGLGGPRLGPPRPRELPPRGGRRPGEIAGPGVS